MTALERLVAELAALLEDVPELLHVAVRRKRDVDEVERDDALVEAAVVLGLAVLVDIRRQERAAAHARVDVAVAALVDLVLEHLLRGDVVGHHALRRALRGKLGEVPVRRIFGDVLLLKDVDELRERRRDVDALLVLDALDALFQHLLDDDREVLLLLLVARLAEIHVDRDERSLPVCRHQRHDLILDRLHATLDLLAHALLDDGVELVLLHLDARLRTLVGELPADRLTTDVDERREMRKRDGLAAVLVGRDLRDDLRRDVARRGEALRLLDHRPGDDRAVLQHVLEVHEIAVVHVLRIIVHVVKVDEAVLVRLHHVLRQEESRRDVLRHLARHVVALHRVDRRVLVRVLLLDVLVVALDEGEDLLVGRIRLAGELALVAVDDVLLRDLMGAHLHDLVLDDILDLLDRHRTVARRAHARNLLRNQLDAALAQGVLVVHRLTGLANRVLNLDDVKFLFLARTLDDLHRFHYFPCY